jgi:phosphoglycerate dehydrogenase-like enzyme
MAGLVVAQQFGPAVGQALRDRLPTGPVIDTVIDTSLGPEGWDEQVDVLLAGPGRVWMNTDRPDGWPGRLRWIQLPSQGVDRYPAWLFDVPCVTAAPGLNAPAIAEFVLAAMLAHEKRLPESWIHSADEWQPRPLGTLSGKTLGLAGLGTIGSAVAGHARGFGMRVVGLRRRVDIPADGVEIVSDALALASRSDHLVLCLPLTPQTHHLVDERLLAACKPHLHLVNVGRGELVDQPALLRALDAGAIAAATLDVVTPEPLPAGHPLYTHPRVRLSPHVAFSSPENVPRLVDLFVDQWALFTAGRPLRHPVGPGG